MFMVMVCVIVEYLSECLFVLKVDSLETRIASEVSSIPMNRQCLGW